MSEAEFQVSKPEYRSLLKQKKNEKKGDLDALT